MVKRIFLVPNSGQRMHLAVRESADLDFLRLAWSRGTPVLCSRCFGAMRPNARIQLRSGDEHAALCCECFDKMLQVIPDQ